MVVRSPSFSSQFEEKWAKRWKSRLDTMKEDKERKVVEQKQKEKELQSAKSLVGAAAEMERKRAEQEEKLKAELHAAEEKRRAEVAKMEGILLAQEQQIAQMMSLFEKHGTEAPPAAVEIKRTLLRRQSERAGSMIQTAGDETSSDAVTAPKRTEQTLPDSAANSTKSFSPAVTLTVDVSGGNGGTHTPLIRTPAAAAATATSGAITESKLVLPVISPPLQRRLSPGRMTMGHLSSSSSSPASSAAQSNAPFQSMLQQHLQHLQQQYVHLGTNTPGVVLLSPATVSAGTKLESSTTSQPSAVSLVPKPPSTPARSEISTPAPSKMWPGSTPPSTAPVLRPTRHATMPTIPSRSRVVANNIFIAPKDCSPRSAGSTKPVPPRCTRSRVSCAKSSRSSAKLQTGSER